MKRVFIVLGIILFIGIIIFGINYFTSEKLELVEITDNEETTIEESIDPNNPFIEYNNFETIVEETQAETQLSKRDILEQEYIKSKDSALLNGVYESVIENLLTGHRWNLDFEYDPTIEGIQGTTIKEFVTENFINNYRDYEDNGGIAYELQADSINNFVFIPEDDYLLKVYYTRDGKEYYATYKLKIKLDKIDIYNYNNEKEKVERHLIDDVVLISNDYHAEYSVFTGIQDIFKILYQAYQPKNIELWQILGGSTGPEDEIPEFKMENPIGHILNEKITSDNIYLIGDYADEETNWKSFDGKNAYIHIIAAGTDDYIYHYYYKMSITFGKNNSIENISAELIKRLRGSTLDNYLKSIAIPEISDETIEYYEGNPDFISFEEYNQMTNSNLATSSEIEETVSQTENLENIEINKNGE